MSTVSTRRHSNQNLNGSMRIGRQPKLTASQLEINKLNEAINALAAAKKATDEPTFIARLTDAFKITRDISRSRLL